MNKQIEELTNELVFTSNYGTYNAVANHLYNKGWRKSTDVAREIFAEIETVLCSVTHPIIRADGTVDVKRMDGFHIREEDYNAIKKKYESEGADDE